MTNETPDRLSFTREELLAEPDYARRHRYEGHTFHGGFDVEGNYLPPRSRFRLPAIDAWTRALATAGEPTEVVSMREVDRVFFPNVAQAKLLLRHGARDAMTRMLTLIGVTEGFGNDGIRALPTLDPSQLFVEPMAETCVGHLWNGLLEAHGNDEAGRADEAGHDDMWYAIRDASLGHPDIPADMFENLPIAPPPGYEGPAKPAPQALRVSSLATQIFPGQLDPLVEITLTALTQILVIELMAFSTFAWAREVLGDPDCSRAPDFAQGMIDCIQADEGIHVAYLQCALSETRARTLRTMTGETLPGSIVIDSIARKIVSENTGGRWQRMNHYRMGQIRRELDSHSSGAAILAEFGKLGEVPAAE
jgi:hypothetical protein